MTRDPTPTPDGAARHVEAAGAPAEAADALAKPAAAHARPAAADALAERAEDAPHPAAEPTRASRPQPSRRTRMAVNVVLGAAFAVLVGGVAFAAGRATAPGTVAGADDGASGVVDGGLLPGGAGGAGGAGPAGQVPGGVGDNPGGLGPAVGGMSIRGTVQAVDADSITIELATGTTVTIAIDSATDYHRQADAPASDVSSGTTVIVELDGLRLRVGSGTAATDVTIVP